MKIVRLTSPLPDVLRLSSPSRRLRYGRRLALFPRPYLTLNMCTLSFILSLALLPHLSPLLTSPTVSFPGSRLWSLPIICNPTFLFPSQRLYVAEPEAASPSSAESRTLRSLIFPSAPPSPLGKPLDSLHLQNHLRSFVGQKRLNSLALLSIENKPLEKVDTDDIVKSFALSKSRKCVT